MKLYAIIVAAYLTGRAVCNMVDAEMSVRAMRSGLLNRLIVV